jgi:hypothetical protein
MILGLWLGMEGNSEHDTPNAAGRKKKGEDVLPTFLGGAPFHENGGVCYRCFTNRVIRVPEV